MSEINVRGELSGKNYRIRIAGDRPTADERQEIDAFVRQQEMGFAEQYQERFGASALPSRGVGAQIGEFFRGIPRGAGGLFETAALGLATPFEEETELRLREGIRGIGMNLQDRWAPAIGREETVGGRLGEAVGSMGAIAGSGLAAGLVGGPIAGFGTATTLGAAAGAGEASERARAFGATQEERNLAARLGLIPGALEVVPLVRLSRILERGGLRERLTRALIAGGEEGLQEAASSIAQNLIEQGVYNPEQGTFEGTGEDLGYGAGAGALIQAISDLVIPGRLRRRVGEGTLPPEAAPETTPPTAPPPAVDPAIQVNPLVADARDFYEERAAIVQEGEGLSTLEAESLAAQQTLEHLSNTGVIDNPVLRPFVRSLRIKVESAPTQDVSEGRPAPPLEAYADVAPSDPRQTVMGLAPTPQFVAAAAEPTPTTEAETAPPAQPEATRTPNAELSNLLQELEIPRGARVSQLVRNGTINDMVGFREALTRYAGAAKPENAARVNQWLQTSREQSAAETTAQPDTDVRNTTLEPEAQADVAATQETQDAQAAPSGPVGPVDAGDRAGVESGIAELGVGAAPVDADPAGAQPPVGEPVGEPVLGTPQPDAPEGAQPAALTGAMPDSIPVGPGSIRPTPVGGTLYSDMSPSALDRLLRELLVPSSTFGHVTSRWFSDNRDLALGQGENTGVLVEFDGDFVSGRPSQSKPGIATGLVEGREFQSDYINENAVRSFTLGPDQALSVATRRLVNENFDAEPNADGSTTYRKKGVQPGALMPAAPEAAAADAGPSLARDALPGQVTGAGPQVIPSPVLRDPAPRATTPEAAAAELVPTTQEGMQNVLNDIGINPRGQSAVARAVRGEQTPTPEAFVEALGQARLKGEAKAKRDEWVANAREQLRAAEPDTTDPRQAAAEEAFQRAAAEDRIAQWFDQNAAPEVKAEYESAPALDRDTTPLPARDLRAVEAMLLSTREPTQGRALTPAQAALRYFGRSPDAGYAFNMIAYDAALANFPEGERGPKTRGPKTGILEGQGWGIGQKAQKWIEDNFSPETVLAFAALRDGRATRDKAGYAHVDYESTKVKSKKIDKTMDNLVDQLNRENAKTRQDIRSEERAVARELAEASRAPVTLPKAPWDMMAGQFTWPSDAHPRVGALIAAGRFGEAVRVLAETAPNADIRNLANKLATRIENVPSQVVPAETMNRIRATMSPETPTLGVETPSGVYVHPMSPEAIAAMRREGHDDAASIVEEFGGQILFNADAPLSPELVMHEAAHAAGDAILTNKSHPLTRQLDKLRTELLKFMPATHYGLSNVREFFAEGMTNPMFRRELSQATAEGRPRSAWQQFKDIVRNWLRGVMGRQPIKPDTPLTALDRVLDAVMASNPNEMQSGSVIGASFAPGGARQVVRDAFNRTRVPTKADLENTRRVLQDARIPASWKGTLMRFAMPLDYMADAATKYMPSARRVFDLVMQQQADIQKGASRVMETTEQTAKVLGKYRQSQSVIDTFNQTLFESTRLQIDPRKPESAYRGYSFQYNVLDKDGNITRRVESKRYPSELERNRALQAYNAALSPELRQNKIARAKRAFDESAETLQDYRRIRGLYDSLPADVKPEVTRMFALQPEVGKELVDAIRSRLEALLPQQRNLQDKVFGMIYDKMLAGQLLDPYVALRRQGQYWLSYSAVDPMSVTTDPVTGQVDYSNAQIEQFKHSFQTEAQRQAAIRALQQLPPEQQVNNIDAYENVGSRNARPNVPLEFVAGVLDAIDTSDTLGQMVDPATGQQGVIKQQVIQLMFDTLPESSFMNSFKRREGIRGFIGDTTPITENLTAGDTVKNLRESAMRIARQATDLKYGAEFAAARKALTEEAKDFQTTNPRNLSSAELGRERAEAKEYYEMLTEYTTVPFRQRSGWSRSLTGGAYMLTLGANVSTALITMSQVPLFVAPFLSGKHGMSRTISAIGVANRLLAGSGRERTVERIGADGKVEQVRVPVRVWDFSLDNYDMSDPNNAYLSTLQRVAKDNGVFNRSLMQDELLGEQPTFWQKLAGYSGIMQHHAERYSREVALMSSYHLSLQEAMGQQSMPLDQFVQGLRDGTLQPSEAQQVAAAREAVDVSEKTNGPIYAAAGPLKSQSDIGAIAYLFKRHPLSMLNLIYQTATRANPLGTNDPADRKIAQKQFAGMIGMLGVMSGAMGLPMMQQVGWLYDLLFSEDDEPDFDSVVRTTLGEAGAYGLIDYLTGMKVSERLGMGAAIYRPGFASERLPVPYQVLEGIGGPVLGLGLKYLDRAPKLLADGEYQRFAEAVLPSSLANVARAYRFGDEGIRTMRGDPIVEDIGPFHIAAQALGFMPTVYAQRLAMNSMGTRIDNAINTRRSTLLQRRNKALRDGDFDTVRRVDEEIREFNQRHPRNPITSDTIRSSRRAFDDRTARTNYGLAVAPRNREYIEQLTSQWGSPTAF